VPCPVGLLDWHGGRPRLDPGVTFKSSELDRKVDKAVSIRYNLFNIKIILSLRSVYREPAEKPKLSFTADRLEHLPARNAASRFCFFIIICFAKDRFFRGIFRYAEHADSAHDSVCASQRLLFGSF
jgi:hypothetical protein